ncbi:alpha-glucuronidase [Blastomonas natatoria]|uniref:Xylan alpha-1,2-glucuronidase n=2 Tax=Blastomonas natatoria TaxID=34015 RepID=A0A2V3VAA5_9SPHN|nr:alpha-glucuronidase [Blastomonas natatoria]
MLIRRLGPLWTCAALALASPALADDGYGLWLGSAREQGASVPVDWTSDSPTLRIAAEELRRSLPAGSRPVLLARADDAALAGQRIDRQALGTEGYRVQHATIGGRAVTLVTGATDLGILYGAFALLRHLDSGGDPANIALASAPQTRLRILNHWDNLDGVVERGYSGQSLWDWWTLPDFKDPRYADYARANASIGINGTVLNNVNAKAESLTAPYIAKAAALADVFRAYGIKVYLSARFSAPIEIGGLKTADPRDPAVAAWWKAKADEIYRAIPDFGGFLVKANSEGQPGPRDYGASHADGANMLASAVKPHGGIVMWRAFVYADTDPEDRAKQAYTEFEPLDGQFADNVLVQVKNGAIDFQPREPFHPLFGAMPKTPLIAEFQITKEYLGFATHLAYLGPMFEEVLDAPTGARRGETVASVITGKADGHTLSGMAGVANIGRDRDWSGSTFNQANWYVFGRLAWDPGLSSQALAREWAVQTFGSDPMVIGTVVAMMMRSREAVVDYTGPLGLAHLFATGHHYGPGPWVSDLARPEWNPVYYHRADRNGIGFDRTRTGSNAVAQYAPPIARRYADPRTTPLEDLLWFHHLPWDYRLADGRTLWEEMVRRYDRGVAEVAAMRAQWATLKSRIDAERWTKTDTFLAIQQREARWWRDASLAYWMSVNGLELPAGSKAPEHGLEHYKQLRFPYAPGNPH